MEDEKKMKIRKILSERLSERMATERIDVSALARRSGIAEASIYRFLNCARGASIESIYALSLALNIPPAVLLMPVI